MLSSLEIQNFALIDHAKLNFQAGFTVLTGETGSGKSILLGALNLILGERADFGVIRNPAQKTSVEAVFQLTGFGLEAFFEENDLDFETETFIRREISAQGRSRAFVNDSPIQLNVLKALTEKLIHIHSQHHTIELKDPLFQLDLIDTLSDATPLRDAYLVQYNSWKKTKAELQKLRASHDLELQNSDYNQFQLEELNSLHLAETDFDALETELSSFEQAEEIKAAFAQVNNTIDGELGVHGQLISLKSTLEKIKNSHPSLGDYYTRISSVIVELKDLADDSADLGSSLEFDPERHFEISQRLDAYNRLARKHKVNSQAELTAIWERLSQEESQTEDLELRIAQLEKNLQISEKNTLEAAEKLFNQRQKQSPIVCTKIIEVLKDLKMNDCQLSFQLEKNGKIDENGGISWSILFSPNPGMAPKSIEKSASGGELSRFMLAIQLLLSEKKQLPTLLFDEIDTGVSGDVAQKIGKLIQNMGKHMQVMAITHLPQVASKGTHHWKVEKEVKDQVTQSKVLVLNESQRIEEVARLMSGENINEAALENAKALIAE